jgi:hypothetical protein
MFITTINFNIYIIIEVLLGISIITNIVLSFLGYFSIQYGVRAVTDISANWRKQPLLEIRMSPSSIAVCDSGFTPLIEDKWFGTVEGCNCVGSYSYRIPISNRNRLNRMTCSFNMTLGGCRRVDSTPAMSLNVWKGRNICVRKGQKTYDEYSKNSADKNKGCLSGYKQCGLLDSLGNLLCEESRNECPINKIVVQNANIQEPSDYKYTKIELDSNMVLYSTNQAIDREIISEIKLSEDSPCVDPGELNSNSEKYILDRQFDNYVCKKKINNNLIDTRFKLIDSTQKYDLYTQNGIKGIINLLPYYPLSSLDSKISIFSRSYIGWKSSCYRDSVLNPDIVYKLSSELDSISTSKIVIIVFSFLLLVYFIVSVIFKWSSSSNNPACFNLIELGQCILAAVMLIMAATCVSRSGTYSTDFADFNCGDNITNESFIEIGRNFDSSIGYDKAILILSFYNCFAYVIYGLIQLIPLCVVSKNTFNTSQEYNQNLDGSLNEMPNHPNEITPNDNQKHAPMIMQSTPAVETKNLNVAYNSNNFSYNPSNMEGPYLSHNQQMHIPNQNDAPKTDYPNLDDITKQ